MRNSAYARMHQDPLVSNFVFGNPQELPLSNFVEIIKSWATPKNKDWFAYKDSVESAQIAVAASLQQRIGLIFEAQDIFMTTGAVAGLSSSMAALVDPGDEVIYHCPPWFFYDSIITTWGGIAKKVLVKQDNYELDLEALSRAISPKTRAVIINSPHNPTGKIYSSEQLQSLAKILKQASQKISHPIYLISDESYCKIVFDQHKCPSPTQFYDHTLLIYTYGKTLLCPGQRLGYIALAPTMPERDALRMALSISLINAGYCYPNAIMQYALPELEKLCVDISALQKRRDLLVRELCSMGYETNIPEGTFYILVKSPIKDDQAFCEKLASQDILCLPGQTFQMPGYFRISFTASDAMIERALPGFKTVINS
jgi:aspartate aminotransferase